MPRNLYTPGTSLCLPHPTHCCDSFSRPSWRWSIPGAGKAGSRSTTHSGSPWQPVVAALPPHCCNRLSMLGVRATSRLQGRIGASLRARNRNVTVAVRLHERAIPAQTLLDVPLDLTWGIVCQNAPYLRQAPTQLHRRRRRCCCSFSGPSWRWSTRSQPLPRTR
jgi:hypothetical protein